MPAVKSTHVRWPCRVYTAAATPAPTLARAAAPGRATEPRAEARKASAEEKTATGGHRQGWRRSDHEDLPEQRTARCTQLDTQLDTAERTQRTARRARGRKGAGVGVARQNKHPDTCPRNKQSSFQILWQVLAGAGLSAHGSLCTVRCVPLEEASGEVAHVLGAVEDLIQPVLRILAVAAQVEFESKI